MLSYLVLKLKMHVFLLKSRYLRDLRSLIVHT